MFRKLRIVILLLSGLKNIKPFIKPIDAARANNDDKTEFELIKKVVNRWGNFFLKAYNVDVTIEGKENIPNEGPVLFCANHQSNADSIVAAATLSNIPFTFISKKETLKIPFYGVWLQRVRCIFLDRSNTKDAIRTLKVAEDLISRGMSILVFPEGTRSKSPEMGDFKYAALSYGIRSKIPVVPVSLSNTYTLFEKPSNESPARVKIRIHPAIETAALSRPELKALPKQVEETIRSGIEEKLS